MSKFGTPLIIDDNDLEQELLIPAKNVVMDDEVTTLSDKMANLALDVATAEGKANNVANSLATIQSGVSYNADNISALQDSVETILTRITDVENDVEGITATVETPAAIATNDELGMVKIGSGLSVKPDGTLHNTYSLAEHYNEIPVASNSGDKGLVRLGTGLKYNDNNDSVEVAIGDLEIPEYSVVTSAKNGLMTPTMLETLNNLEDAQETAFDQNNLSSTDFSWDATTRTASLKLPVATDSKAGVMKVGSGLSVTGDGIVSVTKELEPATTVKLGGVIVGDKLTVNNEGIINAPMATQESPGLISAIDKIKLDNIPLTDYTGPAATAKVDLVGFLVAQESPDDPNIITPAVLEDSDARAHQSVKVPAATTGNLGAVMIGEGLSITEAGVLSVTNPNTGISERPASKTQTGLVKIGNGIDVDTSGVISVSEASTIKSGLMSTADKQKLDGLTQVSEYTLPKAAADVLGGIKLGTGLSADVDGTVSVEFPQIPVVTTVASGLMSAADKIKLDNLDTSGGSSSGGGEVTEYELPVATTETLGGIKIGSGLTGNTEGVLSVNLNEASTVASGLMSTTDKRKLDELSNYTLPTASAEILGGIKIGSGLAVNSAGKMSVDIPMATTVAGGNGLMSYEDKRKLATLQAASGDSGDSASYVLQPASETNLGGIKVGSGLSITSEGVLSATISSGTLDTVTSTQNGLATPAMLSAVNSYQAIANNIILSNDLATLTVGNATTANGHTVNSDVPANAKFTDTTYELVNSSTAGLMSTAQYQALEDLRNNTAGYISGAATADSLGGIKVGSGLEIDRGVLSVTPQIANTTTLGSVKIGEGLAVSNDGTVSVPVATTTTAGLLTSREKAKIATIPDSGFESGTTVTTVLDLTGFLVAGETASDDDPINIMKLEDTDDRAHPTVILPTATRTDPGLIIVGSGLNIDTDTGVLSAVATGSGGTTDLATKNTAGIVQIGSGISVNNGVISVPEADSLGSGLMTSTDKQKLDGLSNYTLPAASASTLGGVKIGSGLSVDSVTNVMSVSLADATTSSSGLMSASDKNTLTQLASKSDYTLPQASAGTLGGIKVGTGLAMNTETGVLSVTEIGITSIPQASASTLGGIKVGSGLKMNSATGVLSIDSSIIGTGGGSGEGGGGIVYEAATADSLGLVRIGDGLSITNDGTLSANVSEATTATAGLMSAADKSRLDNLSSSAQATATLSLEGFLYVDATDSTQYTENSDGTVTIHPVVRDSTDAPVTVNIPISGMPTATTTANGLMSSSDKAKLENTNAVLRIQTTQPSIALGDNIVWINPVEKTVKVYSDSAWITII